MSKRAETTTRKAPAAARKPRGRRPHSQDLRAARDAVYRRHIMQVAERVFAEQGYSNTKMQSIAREVGISLGTLYQAFPGKEDLHKAIRVVRDNEMFSAVMQKAQQRPQPAQFIEWMLWLMETHLRYFLEHPDYLRMQLQLGHVWYHSMAWPSGDERQLWESGMDFMKQMFSYGQSQQQIISGDAADQGRLMMALQQTRLANWIGAGMKDSHATVTAQVQADFVRNFCSPARAAEILTADGCHLSARSLDAIRKLDAAAVPKLA